MHRYNGDALIFRWHMALIPNAFVDGAMNGVSLHIEPPRMFTVTEINYTIAIKFFVVVFFLFFCFFVFIFYLKSFTITY